MAITNRIDIDQWRLELVMFLRANVTDPLLASRPLTPVTDVLVGDGTTDYNLTARPKIMGTVTVLGAGQTEWTDYTINYNAKTSTKVIDFRVAPGVGDAISVGYSTASDVLVYGGRPQTNRKLKDYPVIVVDALDIVTEDGAIWGTVDKNTVTFSFHIFSKSSDEINSLSEQIRQKLQENKKGFYNFHYVRLTHSSPIILEGGRQDRMLSRTIDIEIPFHYETIT